MSAALPRRALAAVALGLLSRGCVERSQDPAEQAAILRAFVPRVAALVDRFPGGAQLVERRCPDARIAAHRRGGADSKVLLIGEYESLRRFARPGDHSPAGDRGLARITDDELRALPSPGALPGLDPVADRAAWRAIRRARDAIDARRFVGVLRAAEVRFPDPGAADPAVRGGLFDGWLVVFDLAPGDAAGAPSPICAATVRLRQLTSAPGDGGVGRARSQGQEEVQFRAGLDGAIGAGLERISGELTR